MALGLVALGDVMRKTKWLQDPLLRAWKQVAVTRVDSTQDDRIMACAQIMAYQSARAEGLKHFQAKTRSREAAKHFRGEACDYLGINPPHGDPV